MEIDEFLKSQVSISDNVNYFLWETCVNEGKVPLTQILTILAEFVGTALASNSNSRLTKASTFADESRQFIEDAEQAFAGYVRDEFSNNGEAER